MTTVIVRQGLCQSRKRRGCYHQAGLTVKGASERAFAAGAKKRDIYPWSVLLNFYSQSMKERFPKREKRGKSKLLEYTCRRCGEQHPFKPVLPICR